MISNVKKKKEMFLCLLVAACLLLALSIGWRGIGAVYAEETDEPSAPLTKAETSIDTRAFALKDNTDYVESAEYAVSKNDHPLRNYLINLSLYTESDAVESRIDQGSVSDYPGYGITGNCAQIKLSYNFDDPAQLRKGQTDKGHDFVYSISSDTAQTVGKFENIGVVGTGAMLFQKKFDPNGDWAWQNRDGETKEQLHTFSFTDTVRLQDYSGGEQYILYTPSGADLSQGVYIKITFAYELKCTETWQAKNWLGITKTKTNTTYSNIIETAEFYLVQNSGKVLFHNASNFDQVGEEDGSGALSINDFETILSGDVTLNGFRLDTLGVAAYDITYRYNFGESQKAFDGQFFLQHGRYDFTIQRKIGAAIPYTIFVDRREVNDAVVGYFGQSLFTPDSQRVYTTGEYPAYAAGKATVNLNATDGTVAPVVGKLFRKTDDETWEENKKDEAVFARNFDDYKAPAKQTTIENAGIYKAEFWGNPKYTAGGVESGDLFHFVFYFEIVDKDAPRDPSVNEAYLSGLIGFSDMQSKYYAVALSTAGTGKAVFAFSDYSGAYDFAYRIERGKIVAHDGGYTYSGTQYATQKAVLAAVDETAKTMVGPRYFDATDPTSYQTADIANEKITEMRFDEDVIVFASDAEQTYMQAGLPSLNGRKYRYISPESQPEDGVLYFAFVHVAGFESESVSVTHKESQTEYRLQYDVSVEYQLGLQNAPSGVYTVKERNAFGDTAEYDVVYIKPGEMTGSATVSLFRNGDFEDITFDRSYITTQSDLNGFILKSLENELDPYSIVKIKHNGQTEIYAFDEVSDKYFSDGGAYDFTLIDRQGNTLSFSLIITAPVGFADVRLELEQDDDTIQKEFYVFVGQEIELPTPTLSDELYVFDGWLYDDVLITDGKFRPNKSGTLYVWQQITQKYTYLRFDADGGAPIERIKAEIGKPFQLPTTEKDGWVFGGWQYGGTVYDDCYTPTTASPTFTAVWNYRETKIDLYDGNLKQTVAAKVGEKVLLPFPERTGYTFFGWREETADGSNKIYYGQITKLANIEYLRLDALWIRDSEVAFDDLAKGTGGRTAVHFVDGALLSDDSIQGTAGTQIAMPKPSRAGFVFVGWIWRTTPIAGKIFVGDTMSIPADTDGKVVLEALWIARPIGGTVGGTLTDADGNGIFGGRVDSIAKHVSTACLLGSVCCLAVVSMRRLRQKKGLTAIKPRRGTSVSVRSVQPKPIAAKPTTPCNSVQYVKPPRRKGSTFVYCVKYGLATVCTSILLVGVLSFIGAFGDWANLGVFQVFAAQKEMKAQSVDAATAETVADTTYGGNFTVETQPTKEEVIENFGVIKNNDLLFDEDFLTDIEAFIYSLVMMDLFALGYNVFAAKAIIESGEVLGLAYTDYQEAFSSDLALDRTTYFSAGFISLPRQLPITKQDITNTIKIIDLSERKSEDFGFILTFTDSYEVQHFVVEQQYVEYKIESLTLNYSLVPIDEAVFNPQCGALYSYDEERFIFDPDLGKSTDIKATSINTLLDPVIAKNEYERYVADQTAKGFTVDTMNFVYISYESLDAYYLSEQDETLLGIDVQEFYDMERTVGPNEYYTVDADGNLTKLDFPPQEEDKASWMDRLAGAVLSIGTICVGVIIVCAINLATCGAAAAATPYIMGAFIGAGVEMFMQTVIQGKKIEDINWLRVGIAAVSGVLAAIPGVGWLGAGLIQGATEAAMTAVEGGNLEDVLRAFTVGFVTGVVIHGAGKALKALRGCFVAGTAVLMANGSIKAIEDVRLGDFVKSYNTITNKVENKRVLQTFELEADELVTIETETGQTIRATPEHRFYANRQWVNAEDLRAGDILVNVNGQKVVVEKIQHEILDTPIHVYNFSVDGNQNYFVATDLSQQTNAYILTHNVCQKHHVITNKIKKQMRNNPNLKDISRKKSSIFQGLTEDAHKGYQKWHREYDAEMQHWLQNNINATLEEFQNELQRFYDQPEIQKRFGQVVVQLFKR